MRSISFLMIFTPLTWWMTGCEKNNGKDKSDDPTPTETVPAAPGGAETPLVDGPSTQVPGAPTPKDPTSPIPATPAPPVPSTPVVTPAEPIAIPTTEPVVTTPEEPLPPLTELRIKEAQFWVYTKKDGNLSFNTPWDEEEGDGIGRDEDLAPAYAKDCLRAAKETYANLAALPDFQARLQPLLAQGATADLIFLVVSTEAENDRTALRKLDRDAYFWHWTDTAKKPVLSMNQYQKGSWVWEVIATPKSCLQPVVRDIDRYLDWTARRLAEKGANP